MAAALVGANFLYRVVKSSVERPRPPVLLHLVGVSGFAFPSGHATAAVACWGVAAMLLGFGRSIHVKISLWTGAGVISVLIGLSRLYLGVHWWTDVVAGFSLGGLWLCVLGLLFLRRSRGATLATVASTDRRPSSTEGAHVSA
ncbi:MAG: phosphatase PAP2 family protein [Actinomycetota bacterium]